MEQPHLDCSNYDGFWMENALRHNSGDDIVGEDYGRANEYGKLPTCTKASQRAILVVEHAASTYVVSNLSAACCRFGVINDYFKV